MNNTLNCAVSYKTSLQTGFILKASKEQETSLKYELPPPLTRISVTSKKSPNVNKSCPKMIDFGTFTKIVYECRRFGQTNCCHRLWKVDQSPINRPIWSHWWLLQFHIFVRFWVCERPSLILLLLLLSFRVMIYALRHSMLNIFVRPRASPPQGSRWLNRIF